MQLLTVVPDLATLVVSFTDDVPAEDDVKAGWLAFAIFIGLALAVVFLGFSLVKQLRKAQAAEDAGVYGSEPVTPAEPATGEPSAEQSDEQRPTEQA